MTAQIALGKNVHWLGQGRGGEGRFGPGGPQWRLWGCRSVCMVCSALLVSGVPHLPQEPHVHPLF